ncbi:MAG: copper-binding protein [Pyrinomonadaceae bacterium]
MGRKIEFSVLFILILAVCACQRKSAENKSQIVKTAQTVSATPVPISSMPQNKNYDGKGVVTKINLELVSVELDHEEIKGLMPKMKMEFYATKKDELEKLKIGDTVDFVVEYKDGQEKIISIKKAK